jgi:hypothetical protein
MRFRKNELSYYKSLLPYELNEYVLKHPDNTEYVKKFFESYEYNYVKKKWIKRNWELNL